MNIAQKAKPWQAGLIVSTTLSVVLFSALWLSQSGHPQWAFVLSFVAVWVLITLFWINDDFIEESGLLLAEIVDRNVDDLNQRLLDLEQQLGELRKQEAPAQLQNRPAHLFPGLDKLV